MVFVVYVWFQIFTQNNQGRSCPVVHNSYRCFTFRSYSLSKRTRDFFSAMGSMHSRDLSWRDMWIFVALKNGSETTALAEIVSKSGSNTNWASPATLFIELQPFLHRSSNCNNSLSNQRYGKLRKFCLHNDGFVELCRCDNPDSLTFSPERLPDGPFVYGGKITIPVVVIASNRPVYLNSMLRTLLNTAGVSPDLITVYIDGLSQEPKEVCDLYGIRSVFHIPAGHANSRISQHYRSSIASTFSFHPRADFAIILEEDLRVSLDFFSFIAQVLPIMQEDQSVYCVSAWNDLGYDNTVGDASALYRVETMPGLGWVISRNLFKNELEKIWPSHNEQWDWDMWMRSTEIRKGRECIIPGKYVTFSARAWHMVTFRLVE